MLCLNIRQEFGQIEISSEQPKLTLSNNGSLPKIEITSSAAVLDISRQKERLEVDSTPCRVSIGRRNFVDYGKYLAQEGMQALKNFTARLVDEGNQKLSAKGDPATVANIAKGRMVKSMPGLKIDRIQAPNISYTPSKLNITYQPKKVDAQLERATTEHNVERGTVDIALANPPSITMWTTEGSFDTSV